MNVTNLYLDFFRFWEICNGMVVLSITGDFGGLIVRISINIHILETLSSKIYPHNLPYSKIKADALTIKTSQYTTKTT